MADKVFSTVMQNNSMFKPKQKSLTLAISCTPQCEAEE